jgi:hypothetical protein
VVHPQFRKKGVFSQLLSHALRNFSEIDLFFNFANEQSKPGFLKNGWQEIGCLSDCIFQLRYDKIISKEYIAYCLSKIKKASTTGKPRQIDSIKPQDFDGFSRITPNISVERSYDYIKWRYLLNPISKYHYVAEQTGLGIEKVAIAKLDEACGEVLLCDMLNSNSTVNCSIAFLIAYFSNKKFAKIKTWKSCSLKLRSQMVSNPLKNKCGQSFLVRNGPNRKMLSSIFNLKEWMITPGDLEIL